MQGEVGVPLNAGGALCLRVLALLLLLQLLQRLVQQLLHRIPSTRAWRITEASDVHEEEEVEHGQQ
eukprot:CAMPEP_0173231444 /NCGR_PEP_ID=MMETSP1142-20121109/8394_1 /TAXON_ID=483371 /ORGANISM="non described non described, Strain CCMP2298" /LENGTH=65 /DNA_ID=CAMNT_0014160815 /DNA_START=1586 /DNA_END=1780 /DNA_ORIENTATION=+